MIERVARAICREAHMLQPDVIVHGPGIWREGELDAKVDAYWPKWIPAARDALEAMRDVDLDVLGAGYEAMFVDKWDGTQAPMMGAGLEAMIDAMLAAGADGEDEQA